MKKKQTIHIQQDETFLQGINLITGLKINYDRPILTQTELNALCIDQKYTKREKAIKILKSGQMLQKWSLFENLSTYITTEAQYEEILQLIEKYFEDLQPMLDIVAFGLAGCLEDIIQTYCPAQGMQNSMIKPFRLSLKAQQSLFRLCMRSLTDQKYNRIALQQWSSFFDLFFSYLQLSKSQKMTDFIDQCLQYISGSFSMNTLPERRRTAFQMIKGLIERAKTKAAFFNNDTNSRTRMVICEAMGKLLILKPDDEQIRKFILDYFSDSDPIVREKSFYILLTIPNQRHLEHIFNAIQSEQDQEQISFFVLQNLETFITNFHAFIRLSNRYKSILANLINGVLKSGDGERIARIFPYLINVYRLIYLDEKKLERETFFDVFVLTLMDFENQEIFRALVYLYKESMENEHYHSLTKSLEFYVQKNLKSARVKLAFCRSLQNLRLYFSVFTFESEQENTIYTALLAKLIEQSKWPQVSFLLSQIKRVILNEQNFDKISVQLFRLILHCPYYMLEETSRSILYLLLSKRKHLQFFLSIKDKLTCSKTWTQRRNYIILYAEMKCGSSYQFHKIIPLLNYKLITKEKCVGVKLEFLKYALKIYQSVDPQTKLEKVTIKETVADMCGDRDEDVKERAKQVGRQITDSEIDFYQFDKIAQRNSNFVIEEEKMRQKQALMLKKTKTERQLGRKDSKSKTITAQSRTSLRLHKDMSKEFTKKQSIVNIQKLKRPTTVTNNLRSIPPKPEKTQKTEQEKKLSATNGPIMTRIMSGQMKSATKTMTLRRESGFKK